jgi:hypothetical protein
MIFLGVVMTSEMIFLGVVMISEMIFLGVVMMTATSIFIATALVRAPMIMSQVGARDEEATFIRSDDLSPRAPRHHHRRHLHHLLQHLWKKSPRRKRGGETVAIGSLGQKYKLQKIR